MSRAKTRSLGDQPPLASSMYDLLRAQTENPDSYAPGPSSNDRTPAPESRAPEDCLDEAPPGTDEVHLFGWPKQNLLTCDGGGIRGYASVIMIEALMKHIGIVEREHPEPHQSSFEPGQMPILAGLEDHDDGSYYSNYLPCHYFDYVTETSTGGLIAVMLSRWRMTARECREQYIDLGRRIFSHRRKFSVLGFPHDKHHKRYLVEAIQGLRERKTPDVHHGSGQVFERFPNPTNVCQLAVFANEEDRVRHSKGPYIFRSYIPMFTENWATEDELDEGYPLNPAVDIDHDICSVCRATTAAPFYFRRQQIGDKYYSDGGIGINNPTAQSIDEVHHLHGKESLRNVVSFGTGKPHKRSERKESAIKRIGLAQAVTKLNSLLKTATAGLTDCEKTHLAVAKESQKYGKFEYFGSMSKKDWEGLAWMNANQTLLIEFLGVLG